MNKIFLALILFFCLQFAATASPTDRRIAQPCADTVFLEIPAADYPVKKEGLPFYSTTIALGELENFTDIEVSLHYPEYITLKGEDARWAKIHQAKISEQPQIKSYLGSSRKKRYLDVSFCPIVKRNGKYMRLVSCKINVYILGQTDQSRVHSLKHETTTERWKKVSVLNKGKWVKIKVKNEGIYTLTPAFLAQKGFNDPKKVKVFGYGGRILEENWSFGKDGQVFDDLEEIPLYRKSNGDALFFAEGTTRWTYNSSNKKWIHENNPYSLYSYYFITEGENPMEMPTIEAEKSPLQKTSQISYYAVRDHDAFGWYSGGRELYDDFDFSYGSSHTIKIKTPSCIQEKTKANIDISFSASSTSSTTIVSVSHNNEMLGNLSIPKYGNFQSGYEVRRSFSTKNIEEENVFNVAISPNNPTRLNFIRINYTRNLRATDAPFSFTPNTANAVELIVEGATDKTRLWRIGSYGFPAGEIASTLSNGKLSAKVDEGKQRYILVDLATTYPAPEWDTAVENQNLHGDLKPYDMVILIPESRRWEKEAQRLATIHQEKQGLRVKVVDAGQIYNEFSSGTPDATAYRRYMKMLYDRAETNEDMPRYLLLFGNCAWDNRMVTSEYRGDSPKDYLLSFEVTDGFSNPGNTIFALGEQDSYVTDDYFGWLDDEEGSNYTKNKLDLGIGRFPCESEATAKIFVDKTLNYLENQKTGSWKNTIYMLADNGNGNLHMNDAEKVVEQIEKSTHRNAVIKKVYSDAYTRESTGTGHSFPTVTKILQDAMKEGALIFNYTGHGNPDQLSHSKILKTADFEAPSKGNLPLWVMASCEISPYDSKEHDLGRAAVKNPKGGAIAVMCASRAVYSNYNRILNIAFNKYLFANDEKGKRNTMGDAMRLTKVDLVTPTQNNGIKDGSINKLKYALLGDPALPLKAPTGKITIDSINGEALKISDKKQLKAGSLVHFSGRVMDENKNLLSDFNGSITATMADRLENITCKNNDGSADEPLVYKDRTKKIFEGSDSVKNGRFSISFRIPRDISYTNDTGRITFYAVNTKKDMECHGANEQFYLNGTDTSYAPDTLAPKVYIYLNNPDFPDGGIAAPNPVFFADIKDDAGINATGIGIGHDMELVINGDFSNPISLNNNFKYTFGSYNEGMVSYPLENMEAGAHQLSFRVWDVNGNSTTSTLKFHIQDGMQKSFDVYATNNPTQTTTNFVTTFPAQEELAHTALFEVYNLAGQKVWQSEKITIGAGMGYGIAQWNLSQANGARVPAGIYLYKVVLKNEQHKQESKAKKIIVLEQ